MLQSEKRIDPLKRIGTPLLLLAVGAVALIFRVIYFTQLQVHSPVYQLLIHDSALFDELARQVVAQGPVLDQPFYISPLYIYFLATIYKIFGHSIDVVRMVQFGLGIGTAVFTFLIAKRFFGRTTAFITGLLTAVYAPMMFFEGNLLGTSVVTFLLVTGIYSLVAIRPHWYGPVFAFLAGLALSLAITGRPNLLLLIPVPFVYFFLQRRAFGRRTLLFALIFTTALAIPLVLTGIHNQAAGGQFSMLTTHGGINFYIGNNERATGTWMAPRGLEASVSAINLEQSRAYAEQATGRELTTAEVSRFWYQEAFRFIWQHPIRWGRLSLKKFMMFWSGFETPLNFDYYFHQQFSGLLKIPLFNLIVYMPFILFGLIISVRDWKKYWLLYAIIGLTCLSVVLFFMADRYRAVLMPFLIMMAAAGVIPGIREIMQPGARRWLYGSLLVLLLGVEIGTTQARIARTNFANDYYNLSLAHFINQDYEAAVQWGQRAVVANPRYGDAYYNLGVAYLKLKQQDQAQRAFETVVQLDSTDAGAQRNLGGLLLMEGDYYRALRHLETSLRFEPGNVTTLMNLGLAYYYLQTYRKAIDIWWRILQIDPGNQQARRNIQAAQASLGELYLPGTG